MAKQRLNFATYPNDYYTGAQAKIYFGSIWVDDIATISYQTSHSKTPLFGYADHQFRTIAKGQLLVRGSFTIAFKETGYLYSILQLVKAEGAGLSIVGKSQKSFDTYINYIGSGYTVEQALDYTAGKGKTANAVGANFKETSDFEDISEVLEDAIWGKPGTPATMARRIPRTDELDYNKYTGAQSVAGEDIDRDGFDILLTFGNYRAGNDNADHTMISINDVHITGESMIVSPSAEPIGLTCEFFARGINERVSSAWPEPSKEIVKAIQNSKQTPTEKIVNNDVQKQIEPQPPIPTITQEEIDKDLMMILDLFKVDFVPTGGDAFDPKAGYLADFNYMVKNPQPSTIPERTDINQSTLSPEDIDRKTKDGSWKVQPYPGGPWIEMK